MIRLNKARKANRLFAACPPGEVRTSAGQRQHDERRPWEGVRDGRLVAKEGGEQLPSDVKQVFGVSREIVSTCSRCMEARMQPPVYGLSSGENLVGGTVRPGRARGSNEANGDARAASVETRGERGEASSKQKPPLKGK